jgi:hypothetical protein
MGLPPRRRSSADSLSTFVGAAVVAAHGAMQASGGFGTSDVRFFFQLFTNFVEHDLVRPGQDLDLTQLGRVLRRLHARRWLCKGRPTRGGRGRRGPRFLASDAGLLGIVRDLAEEAPRRSFEEALFVAMFVASYRSALLRRLKPRAAHAIAPLLDAGAALRRGETHLARVEADLEERSRTGIDLAREAHRLLAATGDLRVTLARLSRPGSYQLHGVRPLGELLQQLPEDLLAFELEHAIKLRVRMLFAPLAQRARQDGEILRALRASVATSFTAESAGPMRPKRPR